VNFNSFRGLIRNIREQRLNRFATTAQLDGPYNGFYQRGTPRQDETGSEQ
jgi:hypothetical protein